MIFIKMQRYFDPEIKLAEKYLNQFFLSNPPEYIINKLTEEREQMLAEANKLNGSGSRKEKIKYIYTQQEEIMRRAAKSH